MIFNLGGFKFEANVLPDTLTKTTDYNINKVDRINNYQAFFAATKHTEEISISAKTLPMQGARNNALSKLYNLAKEQKAYTLVDGRGRVYGNFIISNINETMSIFSSSGQFLSQNFEISLLREF